MGRCVFDVYSYDAPNGSRLVRLDLRSNALQLAFGAPEEGFGMSDGIIRVHSSHADVTAANLHKHNLVKPVWIFDDDSEESFPAGFILEEGDFAALSKKEKAGRVLTFKGPNTEFYLDRAILREQPFSTETAAGTVRGGEDVDGMWTWFDDGSGVNAEPGGIMARGLEEGRDQPGNPLGDATWDFTRLVDSNGVGWTAQASNWQVPWGTTILDLLILMRKAGLFWRSGADLDYHAYATDPAVDRTSTTFAAGKVRFEKGVNIEDEITREIDARVERSAVLVRGADGATAFVDGGSSDVPYIGTVDAGNTSDATSLERLGQANLDARELLVERALPMKHRIDESDRTRFPIPFIDYDRGDIGTLHTGTGAHDYNNFPMPIAAVRIMHNDAGQWFGVPELGAQSLSAESRAFEERVNRIIRQTAAHSHPEIFCPPAKACADLTAADLTAGAATNGDAEDTGGGQWDGGAYQSSPVFAGTHSFGPGIGTTARIVYSWPSDQLFLRDVRHVVDFYVRREQGFVSREKRFGVPGVDEVITSEGPFETVAGVDGNWSHHRMCYVPTQDRTGVRLSFESVQDASGYTVIDGLQLSTTTNDELAGTSSRAKRCDSHERAQDVVLRPPSGMVATDVQAGMDEMAANVAALEAEIAALPDLDGFVLNTLGGQEVINVVADAGAAYTVDLADGNFHDLTLTEPLTLGLTGATAGRLCTVGIRLRGPFATTLPASVKWPNGASAPPAPDAGAYNVVLLQTTDGGTNWDGTYGGVGGGASSLDELSDVTLTAPAEGDLLRRDAAGQFVNTTLRPEPMVLYDGTVMLDSAGDPHMHEVAW